MKGCRHCKDLFAILHCYNSPCRKSFPVPSTIHLINNGHCRITGANKIGVKRMAHSVINCMVSVVGFGDHMATENTCTCFPACSNPRNRLSSRVSSFRSDRSSALTSFMSDLSFFAFLYSIKKSKLWGLSIIRFTTQVPLRATNFLLELQAFCRKACEVPLKFQ